uniref:Uncharacterized protein n=1 Tax=Anguilla anguilla TaxID=7936 RepID=A0A0E9W5P9_ANGAN
MTCPPTERTTFTGEPCSTLRHLCQFLIVPVPVLSFHSLATTKW